MKWLDSAPSNIALIKYMGKKPVDAFRAETKTKNQPTNASLSYTLDYLKTFVELELSPQLEQDRWEALTHVEIHHQSLQLLPTELSEKGKQRFLDHLALIKREFNFAQNFVVRSGNNFPSDCGLASSASSFAALTKCAYGAIASIQGLTEQTHTPQTLKQMAELSRRGSGSSCRSLFGPWVLWNEQGVDQIHLGQEKLFHFVVVVEAKVKSVSSSQAHLMVSDSLNFVGRPQRAEQRLRELQAALTEASWRRAFEICWAEFWDMHSLFETCPQPFGYMTEKSLQVLSRLRTVWEQKGDGPLVTMDAGPNIHCLFRPDQLALAQELYKEFSGHFKVFGSFE